MAMIFPFFLFFRGTFRLGIFPWVPAGWFLTLPGRGEIRGLGLLPVGPLPILLLVRLLQVGLLGSMLTLLDSHRCAAFGTEFRPLAKLCATAFAKHHVFLLVLSLSNNQRLPATPAPQLVQKVSPGANFAWQLGQYCSADGC